MLNFTVGPVMSNATVRAIGGEQVPYFRTPEFSEIMFENEQLVKEFACVEDLRAFDKSYVDDTRSEVMERLCKELNCKQCDITSISKYKEKDYKYGFAFSFNDAKYVAWLNEINFHINISQL